jgi:hypothetical protein
MTYISKTVDVDVDIELHCEDVVKFIKDKYTTDEDRNKLREALSMSRNDPAEYSIPVRLPGHAGAMLALGRLQEQISQIGLEECVEILSKASR